MDYTVSQRHFSFCQKMLNELKMIDQKQQHDHEIKVHKDSCMAPPNSLND